MIDGNFTCGNCNSLVRGSGHAVHNHCPNCLWSRHVDINSGDGKASCKGMMKPVWIDVKHGEYIIVHRCTMCGQENRNAMAPEDNLDEVLKFVHRQRYEC